MNSRLHSVQAERTVQAQRVKFISRSSAWGSVCGEVGCSVHMPAPRDVLSRRTRTIPLESFRTFANICLFYGCRSWQDPVHRGAQKNCVHPISTVCSDLHGFDPRLRRSKEEPHEYPS